MPITKRRTVFNQKRKIVAIAELAEARREELAGRVAYGGNPQHKLRPNDYGLTPPTNPRPGKTLCDATGPFPKLDAEALLREGVRKGLLSRQWRNDWPQNIWAVSPSGMAFEAELENLERGIYHGYPMPLDDDFRDAVLAAWRER